MRGMALLVVVVGLGLLAAVVTDFASNETVYYKLASYERDALKAEALANSGVEFARLFLALQSRLQPYVTSMAAAGLPLPSYAIWDLLPLSSSFMSELASGRIAESLGVDVKETLKKRAELKEKSKAALEGGQQNGGEAEEGEESPEASGGSKNNKGKGAAKGNSANRDAEGKFVAPEGGFGAFEGSFDLKIQDEESKISLRGWADQANVEKRATTKLLLEGLLSSDKYKKLFEERSVASESSDIPTLIARIFGYIDPTGRSTDPYAPEAMWGKNTGGSDVGFYASYKLPIKPKRAYFDSIEELRLVPGMNDARMEIFRKGVSLYGEGGKINLLTAKGPVLEAIVRYCGRKAVQSDPNAATKLNDFLKKWVDLLSKGGTPLDPEGFVKVLKDQGIGIDEKSCMDVLDTKSSNFTVTSQATVGNVTRTMTVVVRVSGNAEELYYYRLD
jgi:type II secretory pathway component PulK